MRIFYLLTAIGFLLSACSGTGEDVPYNQYDFQNGGPDAPYLNEHSMQMMQTDNPYFGTDSRRPKTQEQKEDMNDKWETSRMETRWQEYKGTMIRVQVLLGSTNVREMRLKLVQNANGMDIDSDAKEVLGKVADFEMKKVCGRNASHYVLIYDQPSFEVLRPTPYFDFAAQNEGTTMREYGFRCVYRDK